MELLPICIYVACGGQIKIGALNRVEYSLSSAWTFLSKYTLAYRRTRTQIVEMTIMVTSTPMASGFEFGGFSKSDVSPAGGAMAGPFSMASIVTM